MKLAGCKKKYLDVDVDSVKNSGNLSGCSLHPSLYEDPLDSGESVCVTYIYSGNIAFVKIRNHSSFLH